MGADLVVLSYERSRGTIVRVALNLGSSVCRTLDTAGLTGEEANHPVPFKGILKLNRNVDLTTGG